MHGCVHISSNAAHYYFLRWIPTKNSLKRRRREKMPAYVFQLVICWTSHIHQQQFSFVSVYFTSSLNLYFLRVWDGFMGDVRVNDRFWRYNVYYFHRGLLQKIEKQTTREKILLAIVFHIYYIVDCCLLYACIKLRIYEEYRRKHCVRYYFSLVTNSRNCVSVLHDNWFLIL